MAFFEEIKAKLGLDISGFERGMAKAQQGAANSAQQMGKTFFGLEKASTALATAQGINMQSIAEGIARFVIGSSKEQEKALEDLVKASEEAAKKQEAALEKQKERRQKLLDDVAKVEEDARESTKSLRDKESDQIRAIAQLEYDISATRAGSIPNMEAIVALDVKRKELADTRVKIAEREASQAEAQAKRDQGFYEAEAESIKTIAELDKEIAADEKAAAEELEAMRFEELSDEKKLQEIKLAGIEALKKAKESGSKVDELAVAKLRKQYEEIMARMKKAGAGPQTLAQQTARGETGWKTRADGRKVGERQVGEDGKTRLRGVIVSQEDIARSNKTKADNAKESAAIEANKILTSINKKLDTTSIK